ncbi:MAG TPA: DUF4388 domain-containing protein [Thermoanaerobaculia bacterium]|nr:DUF4388 domain-containing protein [Thermoanaerobaculia bacterium]
MKTQFDTAGDVRDVDLLAAFVAFWRERTSGVVSFVRAGGTAAFSLAGGEVVSVSSSEPRFESSAILIRAGKLDADALERLGVPEGSDGALAALQAGILTKREWRWGEKIRAIEILADLLSWNDGKYYFDPDARPSAGEFNLAIPRLLLELFLRSRDRHFVDHQLGHTNVPLVRSEEFDREFSTFGLTADAESVARLIDGTSTADEIAATAPADEFAVRKLLAALCTLGLVRPAEPAPGEAESPELHAAPAPASSSWDSVTTPLPPRSFDVPAPREPEPELEPEPPAAPLSDELEARTLDAAEPAPAVDEDAPLDEYRIASRARDVEPEPEPEPERVLEERGPAWDPIPAAETAAASSEEVPPRSRSGALLGGILAALVLLIGAFLYFRSRPVSSGAGEPSTAATAVTAAPTAAPAAVPTGAPPATAVPAPTAPSVPAGKPAAPAPRAAAPAAPPSAPKAEAAVAGRTSWSSRAARDKKRLGTEKATRYAIQLELACETPSLVEAWKHDRPAGSMWLLTTEHGGRECFKILWGRYPTLEAAKRAKAKTPAFFQTATNHPAVVRVK